MKKLFFTIIILGTILFALFAAGSLSGAQEEKNGDEKSGFRTGSADDIERAKQISLEILIRQIASRNLGTITDFKVEKVSIDDLGMAHTRVRQTVNQVPVWEGEAIVHLKTDGSLFTVTDDLKESIVVNTMPTLSAEDAARIAGDLYRGAAKETEKPDVEMWVYRGEKRDYLVYRVETPRIDGSKDTSVPVDFIDAQTGEKVFGYNNLQTAGSGSSLYSGTVSIDTSSTNITTHYMEDLTRKMGTYNMNGGGTQSPFIDADNVWNSAIQRAGVDAHYGAAKTYDYFLNVHGRNGINGLGGPGVTAASANNSINLITSRVHFGIGYNNAFWDNNSNRMTYGDGDGVTFSPLVSIDVCAHEMTHGVTQYAILPNGLTYSGQPGALNESMSDVFGTLVERYARPNWNWKCGEEIYTPSISGDALRHLDNPHLAKNKGFTLNDDPDHYAERYIGFLDNGGVHINSGIPNHAFYLLANGGTHHLSGVNVPAIPINDAARIWYLALNNYMTSGTNFLAARNATLDAAAALFGFLSSRYVAVQKAWCAVGVGLCPMSTCQTAPIYYFSPVIKYLEDSDCLYTNNASYDAFTFYGTANTKIYIRQSSNQFNAHVYLYQGNYPGGTLLTSNDDGGGGTNARIPPTTGFYTLPSTGNYTILASSGFAGENGLYGALLMKKVSFPFWGLGFDLRASLWLYTPSNGKWSSYDTSSEETTVKQFGTNTDKITPGDFSGDGIPDMAVFRPSNGNWYVLRSEDGSFYSFPFGATGDVPAPGDYDGDGIADAAVFRPSNSNWYVSLSSGGTTIRQFGAAGDVPVVADYDGDENSDIAVFRPSNGQWWILRSSDGGTIATQFGVSTDKPVQGDYDADAKADVAVFRPASGEWFVMRSSDLSVYTAQLGTAGDIPAPADYDGDEKYDFAVFRPSNATWYIRQSTTDETFVQQFGTSGDIPVVSAYIP